MAKSIMQDSKKCFITGCSSNLHKHHIFGSANRKLSEEDGLWIYLRADWHNMSDYGIHFDRTLDLEIKRQAQIRWQYVYKKTTEDFIARYGKSYL